MSGVQSVSGILRGVSFWHKGIWRGVLFCVPHPGPQTPNGEEGNIMLSFIKIQIKIFSCISFSLLLMYICIQCQIIFFMPKIIIFLFPYRGGGATVCRASCAVFYSVLRALGPNEWKVKVVQSFLAIFGFFSCCRRLYILWFSFLWSVLEEESGDSKVLVCQ